LSVLFVASWFLLEVGVRVVGMRTEIVPRLQTTWMTRAHLPEVVRCCSMNWDEDLFVRMLRCSHVMGMVAKLDDVIVGFAVYEKRKRLMRVLNFGVREVYRRRGVGRVIVARLKQKITSCKGAGLVVADVPEEFLECQLFLRSMGFRCEGVQRTRPADYLFRLSLGGDER